MPSTSIYQALRQAAEQLKVSTDQPMLEAEMLLAFTLEKPRSYLLAWPEQLLTEDQFNLFTAYLNRRCEREPMAYITGKKEFWSLILTVNAHTLIPRPETELLVETVLNLFPNGRDQALKVADLGTGSGAIALALAHERPAWQLYATDQSHDALQIASNNARELAITNISFCQGSWCTALPNIVMDVIVSNPPYIAESEWPLYADGLAFEPRGALVSGTDGLEAIREISREAVNHIKSGGYLLIEHGFSQGEAVRKLFAEQGYAAIQSLYDLSGQERITIASRP